MAIITDPAEIQPVNRSLSPYYLDPSVEVGSFSGSVVPSDVAAFEQTPASSFAPVVSYDAAGADHDPANATYAGHHDGEPLTRGRNPYMQGGGGVAELA